MKKPLLCAMLALSLFACYTPMNNSGVATTKPWLEVSAKKTDFDGKQYDSCYRFNLRFWPPDAVEQFDPQQACISACCWRSDKTEVTLDLNKNFDENLAYYGRARKYTPGQITFKVGHSNLLNTTKVSVSPKGVISNDGLVKLSYKEYTNPGRLAQIEAAANVLQARRLAYLAEENQRQEEMAQEAVSAKKAAKAQAKKAKEQKQAYEQAQNLAKALTTRQAGTKIDTYFYQMDKTYKKQNAVFMLSERLLQARALNAQSTLFAVSCHAKARTGVDVKNLRSSTFACGTWRVNLTDHSVLPDDAKAKQIWAQ